ncbi:carbohydrate ABC transporter permease [Maritimibacter sp. UBA3975]|uniref:carbohydrate ABC transporter permease n=1 Tax=Maritimibacter sp. UBA3975 TaxID=1946833 RepID=UPI000C0925E2|nr:carbohydrate ABC transporter permease [Maritimibacter sp. UBA3975]MAM62947.1 permease [Maritimibacter sp.]|tara:strand:+ start:33401 stop:34240 length:840 start_codon:yes stop_codon:yes gene_type:complete
MSAAAPISRDQGRILFWLAVVLSVLMLAPMAWVLLLSFTENEALSRGTEAAFGGHFTLKNYSDIAGNSGVFRWFLNSLIVAVGQTSGVLIMSSLAGYAFARLEWPGRKVIFVIVLFGLAVPEQAVIIPRHQIFTTLNLHNTYIGLMLPGMSLPFGVFLMTQFFRAIPSEIDEAALLDNASRFRIFWKVLLPLTLPAQATLGIFTFLMAWNDYWWPLISGTDKEMYTLTIGIASSQVNFAQTEGLGFLAAQAVFAAIPVLIVYIIFQRHVVTAVSGGAVK